MRTTSAKVVINYGGQGSLTCLFVTRVLLSLEHLDGLAHKEYLAGDTERDVGGQQVGLDGEQVSASRGTTITRTQPQHPLP